MLTLCPRCRYSHVYCLFVQIMSHLTLIDHNDQPSSEVEGYLRKLLRTAGGGELAAANSRNEQLNANATLSPKSDVIIMQLFIFL